MARVVQLVLCVAAASELNSCDEKSSMLSLARNHSRCALSEDEVARTFEAGTLSGKKWSRSDAEAWLCERSHPHALLSPNGDPWADIAKAMADIKWDKIEWPDQKAKNGKSNFFYGGSIITGLAYTVAFAESIISGGDVKWQDFVQGIGTVIGSVLTEVGGLMGPILGATLTFALSLFGAGGTSISDLLQEALQKLYEKIMSEVKQMMQQQQIENALQRGKDTMSNLMRNVINMPTNIRSRCLANCTEEEIRMNTITELLYVKKYMENHFAELFGSGVHCVENNQRVENPPPECIQFLEQGALFFQFQAAMLHLNTLAQLASTITDKQGQIDTSKQLRVQAATYAPFLRWSLLGYLGGDKGSCHYDYPACWHDYVKPGSMCADVPCPNFPCNEPASFTTTTWRQFDVPCQAGCNPSVLMPLFGGPKDICEKGRETPMATSACSDENFEQLRLAHVKYTNQSFFPLVEAVENLTQPIPDALKMVEDLVKNATPPAVHNETIFNSHEFCDSLCHKFDPLPFEGCHDLCLAGFQTGKLTAPTTRCECSRTICPKVALTIRIFCKSACNAFPMFPDEDAEATM